MKYLTLSFVMFSLTGLSHTGFAQDVGKSHYATDQLAVVTSQVQLPDEQAYLATQQSIKAYVDAVQGANITEQNQFMQNPTNVTTTQTSTILTSQHAWLMGPITVNSGITWTIVGTLKFIS